jgi:sulfonate transport system substrate-binding protein
MKTSQPILFFALAAFTAVSAFGQDAPLPKSVEIGYQRVSVLATLKSHGEFDKRMAGLGVKVDWILFPAGPQLLEGLNASAIQIGETGEAPPIFAQAAGVPFVYIGTEPGTPKSEGILVPKNSPIQTLADLKGKKVAFNKGSNVHYFLVKALESAGLKYSDIQPVFLQPSDARAAFEGGSLDAWVVWDPYLSVAQQAGARLLTDGEGLADNLDFFLASQNLAADYPELIKIFKEEIAKTDAWVNGNPKEVAALFSEATGVDPAISEVIVRKAPRGILDMDDKAIAYQQNVADTFFEAGVIPKKLKVRDAVLPDKGELLTR